MTLIREDDPAVWYRGDWEERDDWIIELSDDCLLYTSDAADE